MRRETAEVLDPWVMLGALATATERLRLGPMITPIAHRRMIKLAREIVTVDVISKDRLTLGFGFGVDTSGELSKFDEGFDPRVRGEMLDEGVAVLAALLAGETVQHCGGFDIALSTTPGEPVGDYARETATWAIHVRPALAGTDAVFEIVTTGPPD